MRVPQLVVSFLCLSVLTLSAQAPALKIVVLEGENGVNIIQQKTAVRPLVEVRDRNNLPVPGAAVTFTIGGGGQSAAFAGGVQTLTVTTNAAGQAAAGGLNALSSGAFQIQVSAAYQGQIATAAISQTNFATAAAAAQAGASAGGAGGAGGGGGSATGASGGAAGGGGGISGTTIGIVGAAVGGGAIAATQVVKKASEGEDGGGGGRSFSGQFSGTASVTTTVDSIGTSVCVSTRAITGTLKITLEKGDTNGNAEGTGTMTEVGVTNSPNCSPQPGPQSFNPGGPVSGGPGALTFSSSSTATGNVPSPATGSTTVTESIQFKGSLSGNTITGTISWQRTGNGNSNFNGVSGVIKSTGSATMAITLQ